MKKIYPYSSNYFFAFTILFLTGITHAQNLIIQTFMYTGATQTFVVPNNCITSMSIELGGGRGAVGGPGGWTTGSGAPGGLGGRTLLVMTPTPGMVMYIHAGGQGSLGLPAYNGGGKGGPGKLSIGGGGGGATDIRIGGNTLTDRVAVAGGGGGGGGSSQNGYAYGGDGGGSSGSLCGNYSKGGAGGFGAINGGWGACAGGASPGYGAGGAGGGFTSGGGLAGSGAGSFGEPGILGIGGGGGDSLLSYGGNPGFTGQGIHGAGGGGGGYYGGSGGMSGDDYSITSSNANGGGGGGSSYADSTLFSFVDFVGYSFTQGYVTFTYSINGPIVSVTTSTSSICSGAPVALNASGVSTYTWLPSGSFSGSSAQSVTVNPLTNTSYTVIGTNSQGCISRTIIPVNVSNGASAITIYTSPGAIICAGQSVILTAANSLGSVWMNSANTNTASTNSIIISPTVSTTYSVTGTNTAGCTSSSAVQIVVNSCTGISKNTGNNEGLVVYPNPGNGHFVIHSTIDAELYLLNQLGEKLKTIHVEKDLEKNMNLDELPNGLYFLTGKNADQNITKKIVIAR